MDLLNPIIQHIHTHTGLKLRKFIIYEKDHSRTTSRSLCGLTINRHFLRVGILANTHQLLIIAIPLVGANQIPDIFKGITTEIALSTVQRIIDLSHPNSLDHILEGIKEVVRLIMG